jgi:uncharacterized protein (TIGR00730 family)
MPTLQEYFNKTNSNSKKILKLFKLPFYTVFLYFKGNRLFQKYDQQIVTVYGSARMSKETKWYKATENLAKSIAKTGTAIMTGGGPGIMEAANHGAILSNKGKSFGCSIRIDSEQSGNKFLNTELVCEYFFIRKILLTKFSKAFIIAPGGFGTLDEMFEILNLIITKKMKKCPVILFGEDYWRHLIYFMQTSLIDNNTISKKDLDHIIVTDDIKKICEIIQ